jgi:hypothetical protein
MPYTLLTTFAIPVPLSQGGTQQYSMQQTVLLAACLLDPCTGSWMML